jgi:hypothetical protein
MAKKDNRNDWGVAELVREKPIAAAAAAAGAAVAGLFMWSRRAQISNQLSNLTDQIGEWKDSMMSGDDTAGLTTAGETRSGAGSRSASDMRSRKSTASRARGMSETGGGNASLGDAHSGGAGTTATASGRGRARSQPTT